MNQARGLAYTGQGLAVHQRLVGVWCESVDCVTSGPSQCILAHVSVLFYTAMLYDVF